MHHRYHAQSVANVALHGVVLLYAWGFRKTSS